jgi:hypothetical protein
METEHEVTPKWREDTPEFVLLINPHWTYTSDRSPLETSNSSKWYTPKKRLSFWGPHSSRHTFSICHVRLYPVTLTLDKTWKMPYHFHRRTRLFVCGVGALGIAVSVVAMSLRLRLNLSRGQLWWEFLDRNGLPPAGTEMKC